MKQSLFLLGDSVVVGSPPVFLNIPWTSVSSAGVNVNASMSPQENSFLMRSQH